MNFEESLNYELSTVSGLSGKVFPLNATEGTTLPYAVYISSEGKRYKTLDGFIALREVECEVSVFNASYGSCKELTKDVLDVIISFYNREIGVDGVFISFLEYDEPVEAYDEDLKLHQCVITFQVKY